ncbi:hybrid sensor histidine kinase/response regulator [Lutibacter sp. HS1-25]|uniref:hybrid sensor histidine kinase/response regulator n=1 Tax=Lutibacter sp. HS1-25 TaxID=2485000 RepID=UPI0010123852|nr:hybrid sensor histidine kinase/response regulator [Lutibacter sp. HS1-25]RXP58554.1 hybrid sensor histidine kinase/response regulator [Lutibacter sp. HS1-25]
MEKKVYTILIVDDNSNNLKVLAGVLKIAGYEFRMAKSGQQALNVLEKTTPDLILLDIQMPDMDGFETCVKIKENEELAKIPVIFLTANTDSESVNKAFKSGGVDFVTKPFNSEELLARIQTHITIKVQSEELVRQNAAKDKFFSIISHDLKNPLANIIGFAELIKDSSHELDPEKLEMFVGYIHNSALFTLEILEDLLDWARIQMGSLKSVKNKFNLSNLLLNNIEGHFPQALAKSIDFQSNFDENIIINADERMITAVVRNLISNAIKFTPKGGHISISTREKIINNKRMIETEIRDTGIGINKENLTKLFQIEQNYNSKGTNNETGTGLGLILCKEFINQNNGSIRVESEPAVGSSFIFDLECA